MREKGGGKKIERERGEGDRGRECVRKNNTVQYLVSHS